MNRTTHRKWQESRLERIKHKRMQNFIFGYVSEKNRNEIIARFKFHPKTGEEHFVATGIIVQNGIDPTIQLYRIQKKFTNFYQSIIWNSEPIMIERLIEAFRSFLPKNENPDAAANSAGACL